MGFSKYSIYFYTIENFKYIKNISENEGVILIYKQIGNSVDKRGNVTYGINGADFGAEMLYLQNVCKNITVRINSVGGSVLEGYSVASAISNSTVPVTTVIDGLAASTALWCAAAGTNRKCMDYGSGMIHGSSGGDDKSMTDFVDTTINTMLSNRSKKTPEEIKSMMAKETWLTAQELKNNGFVDEIISTGKSISKSNNLADMALIYNKLITPTMDKINNVLELANEASEDAAVKAIQNIKTANAEMKTELETVKNELETLKAEKTAKDEADKIALKTEVTTFVNAANKAGKIKTDLMNSTIEKASESRESFDFIKNMIGELPSNKTAQKIFDPANIKNEAGAEKTYAELEKESPEVLVDLYQNNRPKYDELLNAYKTTK